MKCAYLFVFNILHVILVYVYVILVYVHVILVYVYADIYVNM